MFYVERKNEDGTYGILDITDGVIDDCTVQQISTWVRQGIHINGVSLDNNRLKISICKPEKLNTSLGRNTGEVVRREITNKDIFSCMTVEQKRVIQEYYIWSTVSFYRELASSLRLGVSPQKVVELAELNAGLNWEFGGIMDTGYFGGGCCQLGHTLRYEYYAVAKDNNGVNHKIVFGETCASDFFQIDVKDMHKLVKVRQRMSEEIELIINLIQSNTMSDEWLKMTYLTDILLYMKENNKLKNLSEMLGVRLANTLIEFMKNNIAFPSSLLKITSKAIVDYGYINFLNNVFEVPELEHLEASKISVDDGSLYYSSNKYKDFNNIVADYFYFCCKNKIEGEYAYNPLTGTGKGEGGMNEKTRTERTAMLKYFSKSLGCRGFSIGELQDMLKLYAKLVQVRKESLEISKLVNSTSAEITDYIIERLNSNPHISAVVQRILGVRLKNVSAVRTTGYLMSLKYGFTHHIELIKLLDIVDLEEYFKDFKATTEKVDTNSDENSSLTNTWAKDIKEVKVQLINLVNNELNSRKDDNIELSTDDEFALEVIKTVKENGFLTDKQFFVICLAYDRINKDIKYNLNYEINDRPEYKKLLDDFDTAYSTSSRGTKNSREVKFARTIRDTAWQRGSISDKQAFYIRKGLNKLSTERIE